MPMKIDLLVELRPHDPHDGAEPRAPAIERCVARGEELPAAGASFAACLLQDFDVPTQDAPHAAIALAGEGDDPGTDYWLRADPVSLRPTLHRIAGGLLAPGDLDWSEARARCDVLAGHLREEGCELLVKHPQRWYLRCSVPQRLHTAPPPAQAALLDETLLPAGPDGPRWQRLMTEAQMLLHATDADGTREAAGRAPANGIWIWGGGTAPRVKASPYTDVYSADVLALGLARLSGARANALPAEPDGIAAAASGGPGTHVLIAIAADAAPDLATLDTRWVAPLLDWIARGKASELRLRLGTGAGMRGCRVTRSLLRRWWRRPRPLALHA